jgi:hypothetical protein|nr:MAG TPA: hypothetical protein [Caudoviricetes sp.]
MSANKFKVGDKVKVRKGLVANKYYGDVRCDSSMTKMSERVLTIDCIRDNYYGVESHAFVWSDEMLEPAEKTLDNLCAGDFVKYGHFTAKKVLAAIDGCYLLSRGEKYNAAGNWYTAAELGRFGYRLAKPDAPDPTIEIDGKKYKKADVEKAIKDLEVVE